MYRPSLALLIAAIFIAPWPLQAQEQEAHEKRSATQGLNSKALQLQRETPALSSDKDKSFTDPRSLDGAPKTFNLGATETRKLNAADEATLNRLKKASNETIQKEADDFFKKGDRKLAHELYEILCQREPNNPAYFFGAGDAYFYGGDYASAFANFVTAWHLSGDDSDTSAYKQAAKSTVAKLRSQVDDYFRLTYRHKAKDPETLLNAATRLWKAGFTKQSVQLNQYVLKNQPLYAQIAAYNLGAISEHNGDYKQAAAYYDWAAKRSRLLEEKAKSADTKLVGQVSKSLSQLPTLYIEQAVSDTQKALKGHLEDWHGWPQANVYPRHWCSEVCPLCAISRTQTRYRSGQSKLVP